MNIRFWKKNSLAVKVGTEAKAQGSSTVESSLYFGDYLTPKVAFSKLFEYYETIPKEQNVVEKIVSKLISRDWSFEGEKQYTIPMDTWSDKFNLDRFIEYYSRNQLITGNFLVGKSDWQPVQLSSVIGLKRDEYGNVQEYAKTKRNVMYEVLDARDFLHDKFIEIDRQPWGLSLFHALANDQYTDIDGDKPLSMAEIFRQLPQDFTKIIHKLGSPRIIYAFNNLDEPQLKAEASKLTGLKPGSRIAMNQIPEMIPETIDGKARFTDHIDFINKNYEAGTGSSANRVITEPSAMADAKEAGEQDDDLVLGVAAKFLRFMNELVIPEVLGEEARGKCLFRWGSAEEFEFNSQEAKIWLDSGVIGKLEVREMLKSRNIMKLDDNLYNKEQAEKQQMQKDKEEDSVRLSRTDKAEETEKEEEKE